MNLIHFCHNWNQKLDQKIFTTIRKYDYKKWKYYRSAEGNPFRVVLNGKTYGDVTLISVQSVQLKEMPKGLLCSDTGADIKEAFKIFRRFGIDKDDFVIILTFKKEMK